MTKSAASAASSVLASRITGSTGVKETARKPAPSKMDARGSDQLSDPIRTPPMGALSRSRLPPVRAPRSALEPSTILTTP
jgi:hypothetical protein